VKNPADSFLFQGRTFAVNLERVQQTMVIAVDQQGKGCFMTMVIRLFALCFMIFGLAACGSTSSERALSGGALGAASGAAIGSLSGNAGAGALIGGAGGAVAGAATSPRDVCLGRFPGGTDCPPRY
jgi:osmotically inducible lipoprotein OsmB